MYTLQILQITVPGIGQITVPQIGQITVPQIGQITVPKQVKTNGLPATLELNGYTWNTLCSREKLCRHAFGSSVAYPEGVLWVLEHPLNFFD